MARDSYTDTDRTGDYSWTAEDRAATLIHDDTFWDTVDVLPTRPARGPGRPNEFPPSVYLLYCMAASAMGAHRAAASWMGKRNVWRKIRKQWARRGVELPKMPPTRGQCNYNRDRHVAPFTDAIERAFEASARRRARRHGLLDSPFRTSSRPGRANVVVADATVPRMPMSREAYERRTAAGEVLDYGYYTEAGDHPVFGSKFLMPSVRGVDANGNVLPNCRLILGVPHVPFDAPGGEASVAVDKLLELRGHLEGMHGVRYDGALRGTHFDALMAAGLAVVSPTHDGIKRKAYGTITCRHTEKPGAEECSTVHDLFTEDGNLGVTEVIVDKGTTRVFHALPRLRENVRENKSGFVWYAQYLLPCGHAFMAPLTRTAADIANGYNRAENLRLHPPGSPVYAGTYGWRSDTETTHNQLDTWLYRHRMIAHTLERQRLVMIGFAVTINAITDWYWRRTPST
ncbi:hypothetical protein [Cellulomonas biazotea]|uniref:Transposase n=1 Tax=Cellulomonas biazotea TaxID=1709 RepID=A0A402DNH4_9CELL|nr:hypothetical protein [Cellulomonas biazotea]GCE75656.1 hypothetical protein CBZ_07120 [Cellulomonas biazotea]